MRNKLTNVLWGLFFIAIGIGFAGDVLRLWDFELFFDGWWTLLIIIPCFISMIQSGFGVGSTMGFIIGVLLLMSYWVDFNFNVMKLIVPAILIFIGLRILFQSAFRKTIRYDDNVYRESGEGTSGYSSASNNPSEYSAIFSSNKIHVDDNFFRGTNLNAVFGAIVLDLRDLQPQHDIEINATAIFAGIDIFVPKGVRIKVNNVPIFGGVDVKTEQTADVNAPTIYLNSTCMFGGIDIK
ncbi:MAG: cell wall-active antibiotics response protein [Clostridiales bacterium]|jgi:predicted membrane protein|nr:cell wall-active antibiotics response protein [Clostridiales bacterium]